MKKKFEIIKTIQLVILIGITAAALVVIFTNGDLYRMVGTNPSVRILCILLYLALAIGLLFIFWDFSHHSSLKKNFSELDYAVFNDQVAGIANRYSCDAMIEKYVGKPLPQTLCCVMLDITNIRQINDTHGHNAGNDAIREFSDILHSASLGLCFVGRNGGNKFMALFEDCTEDKISTFLTRVDRRAGEYNAENGIRIEYRTGRAFSRDESVTSINQLISLSDRRLSGHTDGVTGFANRASCDDIINMYLDKPLPDTIGCVMLDITNIRDINDERGHLEGNRAIRRFGDILREASAGLCFVGRNGGTKFLALFEDCSDEKIDRFLSEVARRVSSAPEKDGAVIEYAYGRAFHEGGDINTINKLLALADRRSRENA